MNSNSDPSPTTPPPSSGDNDSDHKDKDNNNSNNDDDGKIMDTASSSSSAATNQSPTLHHDEDTTTASSTVVAATAAPTTNKPNTEAVVTSSSTISLFDNGENTLEEAFALIQKGNKLQKQSNNDDDINDNDKDDSADNNCWEASFAYCKAQAILNNLALSASTSAAATNINTTTNIGEENDDDSEEEDAEVSKIRALYQRQSREYFFKARQALVSAMTQESTRDTNDHDNKNNNSTADMIYETLSDVNARDRLTLFARLYAREESILLSSSTLQQQQQRLDNDKRNTNNNVQEQQSSLEERLMKLNQSLPSGFKTSEERMRDINRGLNRLGLSSVTTNTSTSKLMLGHHQPSSSSSNIPVKSEFEQVEDIIAQARDEVALQQQQYGLSNNNSSNMGIGIIGVGGVGGGGGGAVPNSTSLVQDVAATLLSGVVNNDDDNDGDDSLSSASSHDRDESENVDLTVNDIRVIQEYVNEAQSQLAQLNVMLQLDGANDQHAEIEFDPSSGRRKLLQARKCLALANRKFAILE